MKYRTQAEVADTLRRMADGSASADPLSVSDAAELERIAAWVEDRSELQAELRIRMERAVIAAYSLGARHVLERYEAIDHGNEMLKLVEERDSLKRRIAEQEARLAETMDAERVNLGTGEITDAADVVPCVRCNTPCTACADCGGQLCCRVCGPDCHTCECNPQGRSNAARGSNRE